MDARREIEPTPMKNRTTAERNSERELVVTRNYNGPARIVFEAWTKPELLKRWWAPKSFGISFVSCEADVRSGSNYRFVFAHPASEQLMEFFGRYIDVTPHARLVWTNDEGGGHTSRPAPRPCSGREAGDGARRRRCRRPRADAAGSRRSGQPG